MESQAEVNNKDFEMYFGTTLRNVGLFLSLATAVLVCGRGFKMKKSIYNQYLMTVTLFLSGLFLVCSALLCVRLVKQIYKHEETMSIPWTWRIIPKVLLAIIGIYVFVVGFVMFRKANPLIQKSIVAGIKV